MIAVENLSVCFNRGTPLERTSEAAARVETILRRTPGMPALASIVAFEHHHLVEVWRERARGTESRHAAAEHHCRPAQTHVGSNHTKLA